MTDEPIGSIVLGGGCFWCLDAAYRMVKGVISTECGYAGGNVDNPDYQTVCSGDSGHAEVVRIHYDKNQIDLKTVLDIFWTIHDPTTLNRQGADIGSQYRSMILLTGASQSGTVAESINNAKQLWSGPITTEVGYLKRFYVAETEHQDYFNKNPQHGYCQAVINPKLNKLRKNFSNLLKV